MTSDGLGENGPTDLCGDERAKQTLSQQGTVAHNLANASTAGYRAQTAAFRAAQIVGDGLPTRSFVVDSTPGSDFTPGPIQHTGRDLDVAVEARPGSPFRLLTGPKACAQRQPADQRERRAADVPD